MSCVTTFRFFQTQPIRCSQLTDVVVCHCSALPRCSFHHHKPSTAAYSIFGHFPWFPFLPLFALFLSGTHPRTQLYTDYCAQSDVKRGHVTWPISYLGNPRPKYCRSLLIPKRKNNKGFSTAGVDTHLDYFLYSLSLCVFDLLVKGLVAI